ncbi:alpha/beta fold hydrolase [Pectobacterium brasiliense]|uniref:alpha/beta fold hydrolase n=1 Tax=Pectobacterium brasiliense TaxID=180957 RepID=UPI0019692AEB|nr:alpha/beta fold hydrolase [Pectobacterium brasiliense]MBN3264446.1 alpha/beta fold hydrolase [Pectobacterium brasiliense]
MIDFNSYTELAKHYEESLDIVVKITAGSVENLSYRLYRQDAEPTDVIIVYHGGGVNRDAGYDILARQLSTFQELAICLVDIRGHGCSAGERGTVAQPERIWRDVDVIMAEMHRYFPQSRRHLFGHSSGAGMLLNYFTRYPFEQQADSLIMLAPELGPFSGTARDAASRFAQVRQWPFIVNVLSGGRLCGQYRAVSLNFPPEVLEMAPSFVRQYSVNMANALTPRNPGKQLAALPVPTLLLAAAQDELFSPQAIRNLVEKHGSDRLEFRCIEDSTHLVCVFEAHRDIHQYVVGMRHAAGGVMVRLTLALRNLFRNKRRTLASVTNLALALSCRRKPCPMLKLLRRGLKPTR